MVNLNQELGDCDICIEFAHFLSNFITLERKRKLTKKKPVILPSFVKDASLFRGNLITASAEFSFTLDFAIYFCSQKYNNKIERSKNLPKCFSLMVTFYIRDSKLMLLSCHKFCY